MKKLILILSVLGMIVTTTGCSSKKESRGVRVTGPNARSGGTTSTNGTSGGLTANNGGVLPGTGGASSYGWDILSSNQIEHPAIHADYGQIKKLLSAQMNVDDSNTLGNFSSAGTGVVFAGQIRYTNGQLDAANSRIGIILWDSIAAQNSAYAIRVYMGPERNVQTQGEITQNSFMARWQDEYGAIEVHSSQNNVNQVEIWFNNTQTQVTGYSQYINQWEFLGFASYSNVNGNLILQ